MSEWQLNQLIPFLYDSGKAGNREAASGLEGGMLKNMSLIDWSGGGLSAGQREDWLLAGRRESGWKVAGLEAGKRSVEEPCDPFRY